MPPSIVAPLTIDPTDSPPAAIAGRVVTMNAASTVLPSGVIYMEKGNIVAVQAAEVPAPAGFEGVKPVASGGTIYPGLIELHNHLAYNVLRLWDVPKKFANRDRWAGIAEYHRNIGTPMRIIGESKQDDLLPALVRYVECKCLVGGASASQGIELASNHGARRFYRGIVRNVENTEDPELPDALAKISDVEAVDVTKFYARLAKQSCFLLHLAEGQDEVARSHFEALHRPGDGWAITPALAGIHSAALADDDFKIVAQLGGAMVWSPLSNLLLYGGTARVADAKRYGVRIGLGADWSPSGSKNILGELKAARLASEWLGGVFTDAELVAMVTRVAADILRWQAVAGSLKTRKRADLIVISGTDKESYAQLIEARETDIALVMIAGEARYGKRALVSKLTDAALESVRIGGEPRVVNLVQQLGDPVVGAISLGEATDILTTALHDLPKLAQAKKAEALRPNVARALGLEPVRWSLALDELQPTGAELRPRIVARGKQGRKPPAAAAAAAAAIEAFDVAQVVPLELDPLTVADDPDFLDLIERERNLPDVVRTGLRGLYA